MRGNLREPKTEDRQLYEQLQNVTFLNERTAIVTGYIARDEGSSKKNGLYRTADHGQSWELIDFGGDAWIYDAFADAAGHAWIGGSSGAIHFSNDFGKTWRQLNSPYDQSSRMNTIVMKNEMEGISGASANKIYVTGDNWLTSKSIPTPFDQNKYVPETEGYPGGDAIRKLCNWGDHIVISQNGHVFFSKQDTIEWKSFPVNITDFVLDRNSSQLFAIGDSSRILSFSSPETYTVFSDVPLPETTSNIMFANHTIFLNTDRGPFYAISKQGVKKNMLYTLDKKTKDPDSDMIRKGIKITWGISGGHIYLKENDSSDWYREHNLDMYVNDYELLNDSLALLWDGLQNKTYQYDLRDHKAVLYRYVLPLQPFLNVPLKSFLINAGTGGCFHYLDRITAYKKNSDSFTTHKVYSSEHVALEDSIFVRSILYASVTDRLNAINADPYLIPGIADFNITAKDKSEYYSPLPCKNSVLASVHRVSTFNQLPGSLRSLTKALSRGVSHITPTNNQKKQPAFLHQIAYTLSSFQPWTHYCKSSHEPSRTMTSRINVI
ncbi:MAG: hypothetical protein EOO38_06100 [Cytophagaceae bacterium]|nr:MAG: hypothetical protein EOO38_06100 [Cytophagaceae bacterium]